jgi:hypothetical protein
MGSIDQLAAVSEVKTCSPLTAMQLYVQLASLHVFFI